jgi:hypothetical protein
MFDKILKAAMESSGEVIVETKYACDGVKGRILDFDGSYFTVFHNGPGGGMLWAFKLEDIAYCGLVVELPTSLTELSEPDPAKEIKPSIESLRSCSHRQEEGEL